MMVANSLARWSNRGEILVGISRIAVLTSGGDAPGMNSAIRAVVRIGSYRGVEVLGVEDGYEGLIGGRFVPMATLETYSASGIDRLGGTVLGTARSAEFRTESGLQAALTRIEQENVEALVIIGGEGSLHGAQKLHQRGCRLVFVPASIDNDVGGTSVSIGVDTAINTALDAIDKLKDTASAFHRAFLVEVMGRDSGWLALQSAIAAGVDMVLVPEVPFEVDQIVSRMKKCRASGKSHFVLVAAEGISPTVSKIHEQLTADQTGFESRLTILGHIQRGGSPTAFDRLLAARLAARAVEELMEGRTGTVIGFRNMQTVVMPLDQALAEPPAFSEETYRFAEILSG
jgi:6-phosphofructokinase 1